MFTHAQPDILVKKRMDGPSVHPQFSKGLTKSLYARETISGHELILVVVAISQTIHNSSS